MVMMMVMIPKVLIADNDDAGSKVPTNTDDQENAASQKGDLKNIYSSFHQVNEKELTSNKGA